MDLQKKHKSLSLGGHLYKFYLKGEDTGRALTLFEANIPPRDIGPHRWTPEFGQVVKV